MIKSSLQKGKGKSKGKRTTGLGFGRKRNPKGKDGNVLKCHECDSEEHLVAQCPIRNAREINQAMFSQQQQTSQQHWFANTSQAQSSEAGPLDDLVENPTHVFMTQTFEIQPQPPTATQSGSSSDWTIPTTASYSIPPTEPTGDAPEGATTPVDGTQEPYYNQWSQHFRDLQMPMFHTDQTEQQMPIPPSQPPESILGGRFPLQLPTSKAPVPKPPLIYTHQPSGLQMTEETYTALSVPKPPPPGLRPVGLQERTSNAYHVPTPTPPIRSQVPVNGPIY